MKQEQDVATRGDSEKRRHPDSPTPLAREMKEDTERHP